MQLNKNEQASIKNILRNPEIECIAIVDPAILQKNIDEFRGILGNYRFSSTLHYVMKVNQSICLLKEAKKSGCRVDVSSYSELMKSIGVGYTGDMITANGPKNQKFLSTCIELDCTIAVDNLSELESIIAISREFSKKQKILIRLGGFEMVRSTRFGITREHWEKSIEKLSEGREYLEVLGYSFHIDTRGVGTRQDVFWESLIYYRLLLEGGWSPGVINMGGGYGTKYRDDTHMAHESCTRYHLGSRLYPQDDSPVGSSFLRKFLDSSYDTRGSIGRFLEENDIELSIEPGRSLLSQVGYVATSIIAKRSDAGSQSLIIDTNSFALGMREEELPTDPYLLGETGEKSHTYSLLGNLCLESDIIYCRRVRLARETNLGDILIFPDIAAYHMDFYETRSIEHPRKSRYYRENDELFPDL